MKVTGPAPCLQSFVDRYLYTDAPGIAYNLQYIEN